MMKSHRVNGQSLSTHNAWLQIGALCLVASALTIVSEPLADAVRIPLGFWLIMRAKPDALVGLIILYLGRSNFYLIEDLRTMGSVSERALAPESLRVLGFPVNLPTLNCAFVAIRVLWERVNRANTFKRRGDWTLLNVWIVGLAPALIAFGISFLERNENWTRGMRFYLIAGSYFYGLILLRSFREQNFGDITSRLFVFMGFMLVAMNAAVYWSHHGFLFIAVSLAVGIQLLFAGRGLARVTGAVLVALAVRYAISSTLTILMAATVAGGFSLSVAFLRQSRTSAPMLRWVGILCIAGAFLFSLFVVEYARRFQIGTATFSADTDAGFRDRFIGKMFADRLALWQPAYDQIRGGPYLLVPSGRPLTIKEFGADDWVVGAHNVPIEVIRNLGPFLGFLVLAIYVFGLLQLLRVICAGGNIRLRCVACGLFGVAVAGVATGDFPSDMVVGIFIWMLIGAVVELDSAIRLRFNWTAEGRRGLPAGAREARSGGPLRRELPMLGFRPTPPSMNT